MDKETIMRAVDHTLLRSTSTWDEIREICEESIKYQTASICIPPAFVERVHTEFGERVRICTVIGFPLGYNTTACKVFEAKDAIAKGAEEVDMVINQGWVKDGLYDMVTGEIAALRAAAGDKILKVIVETCNLTDEELIRVCKCVTEAKADYIKTSTGFASSGATFAGVRIMAENIGPRVKIKAAGGIRTESDMEQFLALGCSRLGTSSAIKILFPNK